MVQIGTFLRFKGGSSGNGPSTSDITWDYFEQMGCIGQWVLCAELCP